MPRRATLVFAACIVLPALPVLAADCDMRTDMLAPDFAPVAATIDTPYPIGLINDCAADGTCPSHEPLKTGDRVIITSDIDERQACAVHIGPAPDFIMESGRVIMNIAKPDEERATDWSGDWQSGVEQFIAIRQGGSTVSISGSATWGMSDPERVAKGAVNVGGFGAVAKPKTSRVAFSFDDDWNALPYDRASAGCSVQLWLAGEFLVAVDNNMCGGMNVSFTGIYTRRGGTP